jgi:hypothetical protein
VLSPSEKLVIFKHSAFFPRLSDLEGQPNILHNVFVLEDDQPVEQEMITLSIGVASKRGDGESQA